MAKKKKAKSKKKKVDWTDPEQNPLIPQPEKYYEEHGNEIQEALEKHEWIMLIGGEDYKRDYMVERLVADYVEARKLPILKHTKGFYSQKDINASYFKYINLKGSDSVRRDKFLLGPNHENADIKLLTNGDPLKWFYGTGGGFLIQLYENSDLFLYLDNMCCDDFALLQTFLEEVYDIMVHPYSDIHQEPARLPGILIISVPSGEDFKKLWEEGWCNMFRPIDLEDIEIKEKRLKERQAQGNTLPKLRIDETTLVYYKKKGQFKLYDDPAPPLSKRNSNTLDTKLANILMESWVNGEGCPFEKLVGKVISPIPGTIRNALNRIKTNLDEIGVKFLDHSEGKYPLPEGAVNFLIKN